MYYTLELNNIYNFLHHNHEYAVNLPLFHSQLSKQIFFA